MMTCTMLSVSKQGSWIRCGKPAVALGKKIRVRGRKRTRMAYCSRCLTTVTMWGVKTTRIRKPAKKKVIR